MDSEAGWGDEEIPKFRILEKGGQTYFLFAGLIIEHNLVKKVNGKEIELAFITNLNFVIMSRADPRNRWRFKNRPLRSGKLDFSPTCQKLKKMI